MTVKSLALLGLLALGACAPAPVAIYGPGSTGALGPDLVAAPAGSVLTSDGGIGVSGTGRLRPASLARPAPDAATADAFAVAFLDTLQPRSFANRREYCGYFIVTSQGTIAATPPVPGTLASCTQRAPGRQVFASYHTHGAYDRGYDNEVPSPEDLMGDFAFGIDGYVSTPGGRIWRIEFDDRAALLVCGPACVAVDPGFVPEDEAGIFTRYTLRQLAAR